MLKKFLISPPFGSYIERDWATSVHGTYTLKRRPGLIKQTMKTFRHVDGGWINQIGFRNKGIKNVRFSLDAKASRLISVAGLGGDSDWCEILDTIPSECMVEVNIGCPNVGGYSIDNDTLRSYVDKFQLVVLKIPPTGASLARVQEARWKSGLKYVHLSNTLPTEKGGISGEQLKKVNLPLVAKLRFMLPDIKIIAGGGIYSADDISKYKKAGADYYSLATVWLTPWKIKKIIDNLE